MNIYCNTGDPRLDEMGETIIANAVAMLEPAAFHGRIVMSADLSDEREGDGMILLYEGEQPPVDLPSHVYPLRRPYAIRALEGVVRALLGTAPPSSIPQTPTSEPPPQQEAVLLFDGRRVTLDDRAISLTGREAAVFSVLYAHLGEAVSREELCRQVWGEMTETNLCDVYICRLRRVLAPLFGKGFLVHIRNGGYMLRI